MYFTTLSASLLRLLCILRHFLHPCYRVPCILRNFLHPCHRLPCILRHFSHPCHRLPCILRHFLYPCHRLPFSLPHFLHPCYIVPSIISDISCRVFNRTFCIPAILYNVYFNILLASLPWSSMYYIVLSVCLYIVYYIAVSVFSYIANKDPNFQQQTSRPQQQILHPSNKYHTPSKSYHNPSNKYVPLPQQQHISHHPATSK